MATTFAVDTDPALGPITQEAALRAAGASGLVAIALIHFMDFFSKIKETPYVGILYLGLIATCLGLAVALVSGRRLAAAWRAVAAVALLTALAYVTSRTVGLPFSNQDIGNWLEPLGLASLFVEGLVVSTAVWALSFHAPTASRGRPRR